MFDLPNDGSYKLLPGGLHAYRASADHAGHFMRSGHPKKDREDEKNNDDERWEDSRRVPYPSLLKRSF
jgi:hypothetical protein